MEYKLIVGLGNPGLQYKYTRHNIGFMFMERLEKEFNLNFKLDKNFKCMITKENIVDINNNEHQVIFIKPVTYMNNSGEAVQAVTKFYNIDTKDIMIIHDDLDLPVGKIRIRPNGSSGGQKGMQSIIDHLGTNEIKRIRIGIDKGEDVIDYVLGKFSKDDKEKVDISLDKASMMVKTYLALTFENFMNEFNKNA